ncbi:hypothetical protein A3D79_03455 [Candidatus Daviesbacteria bacterium RIFCSPHIGHO2_02_FULL_39_8]|nr:MAG: hypothetical protein A3D79_03455 [Candidatus Daviesbacteria bacterium RIFCSPHIGHO2_02_FULL_39_8]
MFLTFFALLTFILLAAGSQKTLVYFESRPQVIVFFKDGVDNQDIAALDEALKKDPRVSATKYVSKEDALKKYQEDNKDEPFLLELVSASILPASLEISTKTPEDLAPISEVLSKEPAVEQVFIPKDVIERLTSITRIIRIVGGTTVAFLMVFATLVILMIIGFKIRLKRGEIEIMRLIGASPAFIRNPFILEGLFYGVVGALLAWVVSYGLLWYFTPYLKDYFKEVKLLPVDPIFMSGLLGVILLAACFVGALGSYGAVRRYLKI